LEDKTLNLRRAKPVAQPGQTFAAALADAHCFANGHRFANCHRKAETKYDREVVAQGVAQLDSATAGHAARR